MDTVEVGIIRGRFQFFIKKIMANILELSSSVRSVFEQHPNTYISAIEIAEQINSTKESVLEVLNNQNYIKSRIFENNGEAVYIVKTIINRVR
jgi:hypothetical protein